MRAVRVRVAKRNDRDGYTAFWVDPLTGKRQARKLRSVTARDAEREAVKLEAELNDGGGALPDAITLDYAVEEARRTWWGHRSRQYQYVMDGAISQFKEIVGNPCDLSAITNTALDEYKRGLKERVSEATTHTYLKHFRTFLSWCRRQGYILKVPPFSFDRQRNSMMRGKPINDEEFYRLRCACETVPVERLVICMYLGGLRVSEAVKLSWDEPPFMVDFSGRHPKFLIYGEGQKSGKDEAAPMVPEMAEWLRSLPEPHSGLVCGFPYSKDFAGREVSAAARRAGLKATAHDLRRSFGTRWAMKSKPAVLARLMRHSSITTSMRYYVSIDADDIGDLLYGASGTT